MIGKSLEQLLDSAHERLTELQRRASGVTGEERRVAEEALEQLSSALEELAVSAEEVREQNAMLSMVQEELWKERAKYRDLFQLAPDGYVVTDAKGIITEANEAAVKLFHFSENNLVGHPLRMMIDPKDNAAFSNLMRKVTSSHQIHGRDLHVQPGNRFPKVAVALRAVAARDATGEITSIRWLLRDVTERENLLAQVDREKQEAHRRADEAEEGRRLLEALMNSVPEGILIFNVREQRISGTSEFGLKLLGIPTGQINGITLEERLSAMPVYSSEGDALPKEKMPLYRSAILGEVVTDEEHVVETLDGRRVTFLCNAAPIRDGGGNITDAILVWRDISERKRYEEALQAGERFMEAIINAMSTHIAVIDPLGEIIAVNNAWLDFAEKNGHPPREQVAVGSNYMRICRHASTDSEDAEKALQGIQAVLNGEQTQFQMEYACHSPKEQRWFLMTVVPFPQDNGGAVISHVNITANKQYQEQLKHLTDDLSRSNHDLEQFAYVASHDLQEPLRGVTGHMQMLKKFYKDKFDDRANDMLDFAIGESKKMSAMVLDLLDYSRVGSRGERFQPVEMQAILDSALSALKTRIEESGTIITHDALPTITADSMQMTQVLQNLLSNAIKFRAKDRPCEIQIGCQERLGERGQEFLFSVRDNGIGIAPRHQERIFTIFQRLHSQGQYEGTGIGLSIVKKIIERHGGRIWVESEDGQGATFYFTLPK